MSKSKKKTRKQKVIADLHRQLYSLKSQAFINSQPLQEEKSTDSPKIETVSPVVLNKPLQSNLTTTIFPYLRKDMSKTGILTMSILALQFILFFLLKSHILKLPGIVY